MVCLKSLMSLIGFCVSCCNANCWLCGVISKLPLSFLCVCASHHLSIYHFCFCKKIIFMMLRVMPSTSGPCDCIKKIVKKEGGNSLSLSARGFTTPLYTEVPKLFNGNGTCNFSKKYFAKKYYLCCLGMCPKHIKILEYCMKKETDKCFGPVENKNGHRHIECLDPKLIAKLGKLWMIVHQKLYVLAFRIITLSMARDIMCEKKASN